MVSPFSVVLSIGLFFYFKPPRFLILSFLTAPPLAKVSNHKNNDSMMSTGTQQNYNQNTMKMITSREYFPMETSSSVTLKIKVLEVDLKVYS